MKLVLNLCAGGYGLSDAAKRVVGIDGELLPRDHPLLVACVEFMGAGASGMHANLKVIEIPDGIDWEIVESPSGWERVYEKGHAWPEG